MAERQNRRPHALELHALNGISFPLTIPDLKARDLDSSEAEGIHVRSFQRAITRLRKHPAKAHLDIHLPGPLIDHPDQFADYEKVYRTGIAEVAALLRGVRARPL